MELIHYFVLLNLCLVKIDSALMVITYIKINAINKFTKQSVEVCGNSQPTFNSRSKNVTINYLKSYDLYFPEDETVLCNPENPPNFYGKVLLDGYPINPDWPKDPDKCQPDFYNFTIDRIMFAQKFNSSAMLLRHDNLFATFCASDLNDSHVHIPLYYINEHAFKEIGKLYNYDKTRSNEVELSFIEFDEPPIAPAILIVLALAMICIILGGLWSGYTHQQLYLFHMERKRRRGEVAVINTVVEPITVPEEEVLNKDTHLKSGFSAQVEPPSQPFNWCTLGFFVILIVGFLMLLYYFNEFLIWFIIVMYTIGSSCAVYACLSFLMDKLCHFGTCGIDLVPFAERLERRTNRDWSAFKFSLQYRKIFLYAFSVAFAVTWCVFRKNPYALIAHNILSMFFCIYLIHHMRLPSLMWLTFLLSALVIYDVFMVYITPFITGNCSVMVEVATGGDCSKQGGGCGMMPDPNKEELPILFHVPRIGDPVLGCFNLTTDLKYPPMMLGLGDVILPGTLVGFNYAFDLGWNVKYRIYYLTAVIGYFFGMIATFAALILMEMAQPALIFLVPFTLIPTHLVALYKKHWKLMWKGHYPWVEELNPMLDSTQRTVEPGSIQGNPEITPPLAQRERSSSSES